MKLGHSSIRIQKYETYFIIRGDFVTVNAYGVVMPNPSAAAMEMQKRNRDLCTILSRVITAEMHRRAGTA